MKKLLILLSLCVFAIACDDMQKPVIDVIGDVTAPAEEPFGDVPRITVPDAVLGGKITGTVALDDCSNRTWVGWTRFYRY